MADVGILILDNDVASQNALKGVLDVENWRIRVVTRPAHAMAELATGAWNLVIVNAALADPKGPLFAILRELAQSEFVAPAERPDEPPPKRLSVLFLVSPPGPGKFKRCLNARASPTSKNRTICTNSSKRSASFWSNRAPLRSRYALSADSLAPRSAAGRFELRAARVAT